MAVVLPSFASSAQRRSMFASYYTKAFWEGVFKIKRSCQSRFDSYERTQLKYASICYVNIIFKGKQRHKAILLPRTAVVVTQLLPSKWLPYQQHLSTRFIPSFRGFRGPCGHGRWSLGHDTRSGEVLL